jgi:hypothetical protein
VTFEAVTVAGSSERLSVAVTEASRETSVAPDAGLVETTDGGAGGVDGTLNDQLYGVPSVAPSVAATVPLRRTVYEAPSVNATAGVKVAVLLAES